MKRCGRVAQVAIQFLEVHQEDVRDLLADAPPSSRLGCSASLAMREAAGGGGFTVTGASTWRVEDDTAALKLLRKGIAARAVGECPRCSHTWKLWMLSLFLLYSSLIKPCNSEPDCRFKRQMPRCLALG